MPLTLGTKLGQYEVVESIGAGGMGEVYRARDTKLGRDVAIKILPEEFARDKERLDRFEREARLLAQLNHANIATLHGLEEHDGQQFLVMELVEGQTLAERIAQGPMPVDEAIPLFIQIAEGLEAAHEKGIIHRDLKPANIKIAPNGKPKILDFGLAKAFVGDEPAPDSSQSPTLTKGTALGAIMGTASYMSPEQARGKAVDKRTDIWAFGCCLFEVLTGKKAFDGETVTDIITAVVHKEPAWQEVPHAMTRSVREILKRTLRKNIRDRIHDIADVRIQLEVSGEVEREPAVTFHSKTSLAWIPVALFAGMIFGWLSRGLTVPTPPTTHLSSDVHPADRLGATVTGEIGTPISPLSRTAFALSPDGSDLVFVGRQGERQALFHRSLGSPDAAPLPNTDGAVNPFFSPDGESVGFWSGGQLKKIALSGGPVVTLCDSAVPIFGASWTRDGRIVFGQRWGGLLVVRDTGGTPQTVTETDAEVTLVGHRLPWVLPDGDSLLYTEVRAFDWERAEIIAESLSSGEKKVLVRGGAHPVYAPSGHLIFVKLGVLWAVAFDPYELELLGDPIPIIDGVVQSTGATFDENSGAAQLALSESGTLGYVPGGVLTRQSRRVVWVDRRGNTEPLPLETGLYFNARISPDGSRVAAADGGNLMVVDLRNGISQRLPGFGANVGAWSLDSERVLFTAGGGAERNLFWQLADGSAPQERLLSSPNFQLPAFPLADGTSFLFVETRADTGLDILTVDTTQPNEEPRAVLADSFDEAFPTLSPDGRWLAYASNESGRYEVYVRAYPGLNDKRPVSSEGGWMPAWSRSGDELYYLRPLDDGDQAMMAVDVSLTPAFRAVRAAELFRGPFQVHYGIASYDVSGDGRFLMVEREETTDPNYTSIRVVLNWHQELERLVPTN